MKRFLQKFDLFGLPVSLNFSHSSKYKTSVGLLISIVCFISLLAYLMLGPLASLIGFKARDFTYLSKTTSQE